MSQQIPTMKIGEILSILEKSAQGHSDINDLIKICGTMFISFSLKLKSIEENLNLLTDAAGSIEEQLSNINRTLSIISSNLPDPIFEVAIQNEESEEEQIQTDFK